MFRNFNFALDAAEAVSEVAKFGIYDVLALLCGLSLFLYGMDLMGDALKKSAGNSLKTILGKMTSNPLKGFLLGLAVTAVIQSSSATTVMVVGFVNSGTMTLIQAVGVIMGANVGTAVTSWLTALSGLGNMSSSTAGLLNILKPDTWMPILAVIGICLVMFVKRGKKKDIGVILLGFSILMVGMSMMSESVEPLAQDESFQKLLLMFENPILGILAGLILTAIVQSSSASVGILQSLTVTGAISYGAAIPIVMGQNIGTCVTAMLSSIGANKNGKRAAMVHLLFNVINVVVVLSVFYTFNAIFAFAFLKNPTNMWDIAIIHTVFKIISVAITAPFYKYLAKLSCLIIKDDKNNDDATSLLDDRLLDTPALAVERASQVAYEMADVSIKALKDSLIICEEYDPKLANSIRDMEEKADVYEDALGSYLVKVSSSGLTEVDSVQVTKLLHIIGDLERISDHAVNIVESAEEMREKKISFSADASSELATMRAAISEILDLTLDAFLSNDLHKAAQIEPLEQVVDDLRDKIKLNHVIRLQKSECTIEHGFILADFLTNFERVSDHCSNIGGCVFEISTYEALDMHKYIATVKQGSPEFDEKYHEYSEKYSIQ